MLLKGLVAATILAGLSSLPAAAAPLAPKPPMLETSPAVQPIASRYYKRHRVWVYDAHRYGPRYTYRHGVYRYPYGGYWYSRPWWDEAVVGVDVEPSYESGDAYYDSGYDAVEPDNAYVDDEDDDQAYVVKKKVIIQKEPRTRVRWVYDSHRHGHRFRHRHGAYVYYYGGYYYARPWWTLAPARSAVWVYDADRYGPRYRHRHGPYVYLHEGYYYPRPWWSLCIGC